MRGQPEAQRPHPVSSDSGVAALSELLVDADRTSAARRLTPVAGTNPALDRLADLAARLLGTTSAQVSLLSDVQTVAGGSGAASSGATSPLADSLCTVTARRGGPLVVSDARADDRVRDLPPVLDGAVGAYLGVPLISESGSAVGALCVFDAEPRSWSEADVALLKQLASSALAELELSALVTDYEMGRLRWGLAIEAAGIGSFDWDLASGRLTWDDRLIELFGYDRSTFDESIEGFNARLHPDDLGRVGEALSSAIAACGDFEADYRIVLPSGDLRWVQARGRALGDEHGTAVRLLGAAYDTTLTREEDRRISRILETMSAAFYSLDWNWRFSYVNAEAERLLGRSREELVGGDLWTLFPEALDSDFEKHYRRAAQSGEPTTFEAYYPAPLDGWYELRVWPGPDGLAVYFIDITERRTAQAEAARAARRLALLADVTSELAETLDAETAVARLARLVVPTLGDWCIVTLVDDEGSLRDVGSWHTDPDLRPVAARYAGRRLEALSERSFLRQALDTGRVTRVPGSATEAITELMEPDDEAAALLRQLAPEDAAILPLRARGRTVGLLTLFRGESAEPFEDCLDTAAEVALRAGLALDNARLYSQQRALAEGLQRSLLTDPPEPDHVQVVVRYQPAAEAAQVGGDWYDAFMQRDGATVLVIGDVVGHDVAAAAAMGQLRGLLRGIAFHSGAGPAQVLSGLDAAMEGLQVVTTATAVVARLEQTPDERDRSLTRVRWSNAGHPPPMVINPDGTVTVLAGVEADLLLGIDPTTRRVESEVLLDRGATVLLYTDGLVERRDQGLDEGLRLLRDTLEELAESDLDTICDELIRRLLPAHADDDVALVAVRLHRQDTPRPAAAGPNRLPPEVPPEVTT